MNLIFFLLGDKTPDYKQGPVDGLLKAAGYTGNNIVYIKCAVIVNYFLVVC